MLLITWILVCYELLLFSCFFVLHFIRRWCRIKMTMLMEVTVVHCKYVSYFNSKAITFSCLLCVHKWVIYFAYGFIICFFYVSILAGYLFYICIVAAASFHFHPFFLQTNMLFQFPSYLIYYFSNVNNYFFVGKEVAECEENHLKWQNIKKTFQVSSEWFHWEYIIEMERYWKW